MNRLMNRVSFAAMIVALSVMSSGMAWAQKYGDTIGPSPEPNKDRPLPEQSVAKREQPEYTPQGLRVGSFVLRPILSVSETYDSNIYLRDNDPKSDFITTVSPELTVSSQWGTHSLSMQGRSELQQFGRFHRESVNNYFLNGRAQVEVVRDLKVDFLAGSDWDHESRGDPNAVNGDRPTPVRRQNAQLVSKYKPGVFGVEWKVGATHFDFDDVGGANGRIIDNDNRDRIEYDTSLSGIYEVLRGYDAFVRVGFDKRQYDHSVQNGGYNRNSTGQRIETGLALDVSGIISGEVFAGFFHREYEDNRFSDRNGYSIGAAVFWNVTTLTTVTFRADRRLIETTAINSPGIMSTRGSVAVDHELMRNIKLNAKAEYALNAYETIGRDDKTARFNLGGEYALNRNLFTRLNTEYSQRRSNVANNDYEDTKIMLLLGVRY